MDSNLIVETDLNSVPRPADETPATEGSITDPDKTSAEQSRHGSAKREGTPECKRRVLLCVDRVQVAVVGAVIVLVWCLLSIPTVFHFLPNHSASGSASAGQSTCEKTNSTRYTGTVCREPLQSCLNTPGAGDIYVALSIDDQKKAEQAAMLLEAVSNRPEVSDKCRQAALPLVCLYLFGLCDDSGTLHSPSSMDCQHISTELCVSEWAAAQSLGLPLPECSTLPEQSTVTCGANTTSSPPNTSSASVPSGTRASTTVVVGANCTVQCHDSFYCTVDNTCKPRCGSWKQSSPAIAVAANFLVITSVSVGLIAAVVVFIISCMQRKQQFAFPAIIVQYMNAILFILAFVVLIGYFDKSSLFCSSIDLVTSIRKSTPFCTFTGVIFNYSLLQLPIWSFFHVAILFWKIWFPFHSRRFKLAGRMKYLHIVVLITALFIPVIPVVAETTRGRYAMTGFPPILCTGTSPRNVTFYSLVLPIIILLQVTVTLLIFVFWAIPKHHGFCQKKISTQPIKLSTAEKKILIVICYYVLLGVITLTTFTVIARSNRNFIRSVFIYFECELHGTNPNCDRSTFENNIGIGVLFSLSLIILCVCPVVNLIYVINVNKISQYCRKKH